jgi:hypothetical protein
MAKWKRNTVGSVMKGREAGDSDYVKLRGDMKDVLLQAIAKMDAQKGLALNLESKKSRLEGLEEAVRNSKMSAENAEKARERINKMPDFVRFEIVLVEKEQ